MAIMNFIKELLLLKEPKQEALSIKRGVINLV